MLGVNKPQNPLCYHHLAVFPQLRPSPLKCIQYRGYATFPSKVALFSALRLSLSPLLSFYRFGVDLDLILEVLGPRKYSKFTERDVIFKHFEMLASRASPEEENEPKSTSRDTQNTPKADPEQPRRCQESPLSTPEDIENHPWRDPKRGLAPRKPLEVLLGTSVHRF